MIDWESIKWWIINKYINYKIQLSKIYRYLLSTFVGVSYVQILNGDDITTVATYRFFIIRVLSWMMSQLHNVVQCVDTDIKKAEFIKHYPDGKQTVIVCPEMLSKQSMKLSDLVNITNNLSRDSVMGRCVFMRFEIDCPINGNINMKEYLITYKDHDKKYSHTLKNILIFNDHNVADDATIHIKIFNSGKLINQCFKFIDVKDRHISDFGEL